MVRVVSFFAISETIRRQWILHSSIMYLLDSRFIIERLPILFDMLRCRFTRWRRLNASSSAIIWYSGHDSSWPSPRVPVSELAHVAHILITALE
jgi:hypothetical protein